MYTHSLHSLASLRLMINWFVPFEFPSMQEKDEMYHKIVNYTVSSQFRMTSRLFYQGYFCC